MSTLKTHNLQSPDAGSVNIVMAPNSGMVVAGLSTYSNQINVGNNIKLGNAGVVTATSFVGGLPITSGADNRVITASSASAIQGESTLTYDGNDLQNLQTNAAANLILKATSNSFNSIILDSNRSASTQFGVVDGKWNGTVVNRIQFVTGTDGTNKDDGFMAFHTRESGQSLTEKLRITSTGQINATGASTGNPIGITIKNSNTAAYSHARLRLESQNASKYADVWCDVPNNSLRLAYNSSNSLYISQEGNVGLGTATPQNSSGYATLTVSGTTGGQIAFFGSNKKHFIWTDSDALNVGAGYDGGGELRIKTNGNTERLRIDSSGHVSLRNSTNSHQDIQWYSNTAKSASIGWGNGSANWEFKHYRNDNQADNPYANIDFFTGSTTSPTRALRITNDGNHIREKHSRFATRVDYSGGNEGANTKIPFKAAHVNVGGDYSDSNERFTAPVDGDYAFWFHTNVARSGSGSYYATWYRNGSEESSTKGGRMYDQHSGSGWNNLSGCIMLNLSEGDYVEIYNGGSVVNYDGNNYGQWMGWLVG